MPQRAAGLVIALLGVLALGILLVIGADVYRAARAGPRWRRRLVGAGLLVLASLGFLPAAGAAAEEKPKAVTPADKAAPRADLDQRAEWQWIVEVWRDAAPVAEGRRGPYPFNEVQRKNLLDRLAGTPDRIDTLRKDGLLSEAEAGLLKAELGYVVRGVQSMRPTEMRMATCYKPMMVVPARDSLKRLQERLPLLEKMAEAKALKPEVLVKVRGTVELDLATLGNPKWVEPFKEDERAEAKKACDAARAAIAKIEAAARGKDTSLASSAGWKALADGTAVAAPLARSGRSTTKQREEADGALKVAEAAADRLSCEGLLSSPEAEILKAECARLRGEMYRNPPTPAPLQGAVPHEIASCYEMVAVAPARQSMERLTDRLPLLTKMVLRGRIAPEVLARVLPTMETDIETLRDERLLGQLNTDEQVEARSSLRPRAEEILKQVKALGGK